jgi:hypothetical protein
MRQCTQALITEGHALKIRQWASLLYSPSQLNSKKSWALLVLQQSRTGWEMPPGYGVQPEYCVSMCGGLLPSAHDDSVPSSLRSISVYTVGHTVGR